MNIGEGISGAVFSDSNRRFRYALWRFWQPSGDKLLFIGLNPSTANGGLFAGNLFSLVTANPDVLWHSSSPEQPNGPNDVAIKQMREFSAKVMVGWGNEGKNAGTRPREVLALLGKPVYCIKTTGLGEPAHPLYFPWESQLVPYVRKVSTLQSVGR